jgi:hypothetical protein
MTRIGKPWTEDLVIKVMQEVGLPVTIAYIERKIDARYPTASKIMQEMVEKGKIKILKTIDRSYFVLSEWSPVFLEQSEKEGKRGEITSESHTSKSNS